ncbi:uncharacterized protein LOC134535840 isoform X1 [Bacillus rossius redtenbacheri]|uniref:uncharacterized protein LOC134535840 isoform X1 n=1 Tax=Bacillus rossius redtenbacheri TaxID=93214 RepID=UPI002FDDF63B
MGSTDKGIITGFICRLCSKVNRYVIHIYGEKGQKMQLPEKINAYLPISISANDQLPKTVCLQCIDSLEAHHELMEQFAWARQRLATSKTLDGTKKSEARACDLHVPGCSSANTSTSVVGDALSPPSSSSQVRE